ncbi:MAG: hypothetical protein ACTSPA_13035 [Promethearchaeota archaeon]
MNDYNEKAAMLAVQYAVNVEPGDLVLIQGSEVANEPEGIQSYNRE